MCLCYAKKMDIHDKFGTRAIAAVLMGYSKVTKDYVLFDITNHTFFVNRDIVFMEKVFPFKNRRQHQYHLFLEPKNLVDLPYGAEAPNVHDKEACDMPYGAEVPAEEVANTSSPFSKVVPMVDQPPMTDELDDSAGQEVILTQDIPVPPMDPLRRLERETRKTLH